MLSKRLFRVSLIIEIAILFLVITLTYLPNLRRATIYRDDWYYTVDRMKGGPETFHEMFRIDRPARGYFFEAYYRLFGVEPAPYHAATYGWRLLLGLGTFWLFSLLWPKNRRAALLITILFLIFPGYTRWMEGMEDQPKVVSLVLQVVSYALTLHAIRARRLLPKATLWAGSIVTGWGYLALIDYAMGMEVFRFLCALAVINRERPAGSLFQKGMAFARAAWPGALALGGFLFWRVVIFTNERTETDIKGQLMKVVEAPAEGLSNWSIHFIQSVFNESIVAWGGYAVPDFFKLPAAQIFTGLLTALVSAACVLAALAWLSKVDPDAQEAAGESGIAPGIAWQQEALWIGLIGVMAGVAPVVMANRSVEFGILSHYGLPASLAAATLVSGLIYCIDSNRLRLGVIAVIVLLAAITQYSTSTKTANEEAIVSRFWHQVAWRIPMIREATSILVYYPSVTIGEDVDFVHGPANFIYYPEPVDELPIRYKLFAIKQYPWTVKEFLAGGKTRDGYRTHYAIIDYEHVLAISQPSVSSCVHVSDHRWPWFSNNDPDSILVVGQQSNIRNVLADAEPRQISTTIFGPEPEHGWCYYFEKADLAFQQDNLEQVAALGKEVDRLKLKPAETLEWMPFLQAYALLGDESVFNDTVSRIDLNRYNAVQACNVMTKMQEAGENFSPAIRQTVEDKICVKP